MPANHRSRGGTTATAPRPLRPTQARITAARAQRAAIGAAAELAERPDGTLHTSDLLQLQRTVGNQTVGRLLDERQQRARPLPEAGARQLARSAEMRAIQRLVWLIDEDSLTAGSYRHLTEVDPEEDPTGSLRPVDTDIGGLPFEQLGTNESLHVIVHGGGGSTSVGDAGELLDYLMARGLRPEEHRGTIRLISCFSGTPGPGGTFAGQFADELRRRGFTNAVIGFDGLVQVRDGARVYVVSPANAQEFFLRSRLKDRHKLEFSEISSRKPPQGASQDDIDLFLLEVEEFKERFNANIAKMQALWQPQQIGQNIVHIAEAKQYIGDMLGPDVFQRQQEEKRFYDWYNQMLAGYHHDTEVGTSSGRPSYIS